MIIVSREIRERIKNGEQIFSPALSADQWGEASVDLRIGFAFTKLEAQAGVRFSVSEGIASVAKSGFWNTRQLRECDEHGKPERYSLDPGDFVLALTHERISMPRDLMA